MSMTRWDPFRDMLSLREAMNQLLEDSYIRPGGERRGAGGGAQSLALDVVERGDGYQVQASLPGVRPEDIQVEVLGETLTIRAESKREEERETGGYLLQERRFGALQRSVTLPAPVDPDAVEARYEHGVLTLTLPKSRASLPRRIQIQGGQGAGPGIVEARSAELDRREEPPRREGASSPETRDTPRDRAGGQGG